MARALQDLVDVYVRFNNPARLDALKSHRQKLISDIKTRSSGPYDQSWLVQQIEGELDIINAGLDRLAATR